MAEHDGLGSLQMGVARHDRLFVLLRLIGQSGDQMLCIGAQLVDAVHQVHTQVEGDLVVSRTRGMELLADVADALGQLLFNEHVDILGVHVDRQFACGNILEDL